MSAILFLLLSSLLAHADDIVTTTRAETVVGYSDETLISITSEVGRECYAARKWRHSTLVCSDIAVYTILTHSGTSLKSVSVPMSATTWNTAPVPGSRIEIRCEVTVDEYNNTNGYPLFIRRLDECWAN
ncbi:hypothetical protein HON52_03615 [Candidatus Uhrbacteria bacterium]|jgi:hypothetical protein|nr:hypothetical protein [Candidatus Uhrbacteria bacterium]